MTEEAMKTTEVASIVSLLFKQDIINANQPSSTLQEIRQ